MIQYRVTAAPLDGESFIFEQFETRSDAEVFHRALLEDSTDNILNSVHYPCVVVTFEEFLGGHWIITGRKLVVG